MNISSYLRTYTCISLLLITLTISAQNGIRMGAERMEAYLPLLKDKRVGMVVNHTSIVGSGRTHLLDTLIKSNVNVIAAFAPEHGFRGNVEYGETIKNGKDTRTGVPIISLYGNNKKPTSKQLENIDIMIFDIQDVGARFYTYISTMQYVMEACAENKKQLIILDRPNPYDYVDGPILKPAFKSFVGMHQIPILHGCTVGELARMINGEGWVNGKKDACNLTVIPISGWKHGERYSIPIPPSPNLPNDQSIIMYASLCPFEATNISIGRGTTFPFQVAGAPDKKYGSFTFTPKSLPGFDKNPLHKDKVCYGIDLRNAADPGGFSLKYVLEFYRKSGSGATFFSRTQWMDLLMGTDQVRKDILANKTEEEIRAAWMGDLKTYQDMRVKYILY